MAEHGWSATAIDLSRHSVRKINAAAAERGLDVTAVRADAASLACDSEFDVALICYIHVPVDIRRSILESVVRALKPGGTLLWRSFEAGMPGDPGFARDLLPSHEEVLEELGDAVEIEQAEAADEYFPYVQREMRILTIRARRA